MFVRQNVYLLMLIALAMISAPDSVLAKRDHGQAMVVGFVVPEHKDKPLKRIAVDARVNSLYFRDQIERRMVDEIHDEGKKQTQAFALSQELPPIKEYSEKDIETKLVELGIDAVLFVTMQDSKESTSKGGWWFHGARGVASGGAASYSMDRETKVTIEMYEAKTKNLIWKGEGKILIKDGEEQGMMDRTAQYIAERVATFLKRDGLYIKKGFLQ